MSYNTVGIIACSTLHACSHCRLARGVFLRPKYSLSIIVLACFRFGYSLRLTLFCYPCSNLFPGTCDVQHHSVGRVGDVDDGRPTWISYGTAGGMWWLVVGGTLYGTKCEVIHNPRRLFVRSSSVSYYHVCKVATESWSFICLFALVIST
jgi:hypothetical protein